MAKTNCTHLGRQIHIEKKLHLFTMEISFSSARHAA